MKLLNTDFVEIHRFKLSIFKEKTLEYWEQFMKLTDIPFAKVGTKSEYITHEQMSHNKTIESVKNNNLGNTKQISNIVYFDGAKTEINPLVKPTGYDNYNILTEIGASISLISFKPFSFSISQNISFKFELFLCWQ